MVTIKIFKKDGNINYGVSYKYNKVMFYDIREDNALEKTLSVS